MSMSIQKLVRTAAVAALYTALCLLLAPFSYGAVQVRVAEALTLLVVFGPEYIVGVSLGCFLANLLGTGFPDILFGTLATVLACLASYAVRHVRWRGLAIPAALPPILFNALIVGPEIAWFFPAQPGAPFTLAAAAFNGVTVALGEAVSCLVLGVALVRTIETNKNLHTVFAK